MKIGKQFNTLTAKEYVFYIDNHAKYTDFNTLGLYRSITENEKLSLPQKLEVRDYAHTIFKKSFEFLQLKDPVTYVAVAILGQELTKADIDQVWEDLRANQQKILNDKKIKHRNFGTYSKHLCGYDDCRFNGVMRKRGVADSNMHFNGDRGGYYQAQLKSERFRAERKGQYKIINNSLDN